MHQDLNRNKALPLRMGTKLEAQHYMARFGNITSTVKWQKGEVL
jgi:hypothetical protein